MLCPFQQIHQLKWEKSYVFAINTCTYCQYFGHNIGNKNMCKNTIISPVLIGEFVEMDRALLYMPRIGKKVKE